MGDLREDDEVWVTYRPGGKNDAAVINAEPDLREETALLKDRIARAVRILNMEGLITSSGHISGRLPGGQTFFIHAYDQPRGEVRPEDLCEVTTEDEQIGGDREMPDETVLHAAVYRVRKDVNVVVHVHPHYAIIPSIVGKDLIPVSSHGAILGAKVDVYPDSEKVVTRERADVVARTMGQERAVVLRGHGAVLGEATIDAALTITLYMEENAKLLLDCYVMGTPVPMAAEEIGRSAENTFQPFSTKKVWDYYVYKGHKAGIFWDNPASR